MVHQNILGLDVAVHDAVAMGVIHRRQDADEHGSAPEGVVLRATRKGDKWCYLVQLTGTDQLVTRREDELSPLEVEV